MVEETLQRLREGFARAWEKHPDLARESHFTIGGKTVRLRTVGRALGEAVRLPLDHLAIEAAASKPALEIDTWDQAETGESVLLDTVPEGLGPYGIVRASEDGRIVTDVRPHATRILDRPANRITASVANTRQLYLDERARPFHRLLSVWLRDQIDIQIIHAGLVSLDDRGVLFVGAGGSGKSTTSLVCMRDGFGFLGDDFVGLESLPDGTFAGHSLYSTSIVGLHHLERFPDLVSRALAPNHPEEEKSLLYLGTLHPERMQCRIPITAVVLPRVTRTGTTTFRPATKREAMLGIAPSSLMLLTAAGPRSIDVLADLVTRTPCYWIELSSDMDMIPRRVAELIGGSS